METTNQSIHFNLYNKNIFQIEKKNQKTKKQNKTNKQTDRQTKNNELK